MIRRLRPFAASLAAALAMPAAAWAQADPHAGHGDHAAPPAHAGHGEHAASGEAAAGADPAAAPPALSGTHAGGHAEQHGEGHGMPAMLGPYAMNREASGTAWQPDSAPMYATMVHTGGWAGMVQATATLAHDDQGGSRGDRMVFPASSAMAMASRAVGDRGRLGLRAMVSLDPLMGRSGYPLLFATGETADGRTKLVDRQHPHDLLMELAASYSHRIGADAALFVYAGLPGEPALGPPNFMHRMSGLDLPEAPIGHHWFDSTHITWGVVTAGLSTRTWKLEASAFRGREPDQHRWDVEAPRLDSWAVRAFWNPAADLSLQVSTGHLRSPEQLHPDQDEQRTTASATWNRRLGAGANWATTIAWSMKDLRPGGTLHGWLAETALRWADRHGVQARLERTDQGELFGEGDPRHHDVFAVTKLAVGYQYEQPLAADLRVAVGALAAAYAYPRALAGDYGDEGVKSFMLYLRVLYGDRRLR